MSHPSKDYDLSELGDLDALTRVELTDLVRQLGAQHQHLRVSKSRSERVSLSYQFFREDGDELLDAVEEGSFPVLHRIEDLGWNPGVNRRGGVTLIDGDQLSCLLVLQLTHQRRINLVHLGLQSFDIKSGDAYRNSRWISNMERRLVLVKELLQETGHIAVSADDNQHEHLKMLMNKIFGKSNFVANLVWRTKSGKESSSEIVTNHEHIVIYAKNKELRIKGSDRSVIPHSFLDADKNGYAQGVKELKAVLPMKELGFSVPSSAPLKPQLLLHNLLKALLPDVTGTVLDLAGEYGALGQALLELNSIDGGDRDALILSGRPSVHIQEIAYERLRRVLSGQDWADGKSHLRLQGSMTCYRLELSVMPEHPLSVARALGASFDGIAALASGNPVLLQNDPDSDYVVFDGDAALVVVWRNAYTVLSEQMQTAIGEASEMAEDGKEMILYVPFESENWDFPIDNWTIIPFPFPQHHKLLSALQSMHRPPSTHRRRRTTTQPSITIDSKSPSPQLTVRYPDVAERPSSTTGGLSLAITSTSQRLITTPWKNTARPMKNNMKPNSREVVSPEISLTLSEAASRMLEEPVMPHKLPRMALSTPGKSRPSGRA